MKKIAIVVAILVVLGGAVVMWMWLSPRSTITAPATTDQNGPSVSAPSEQLTSSEVSVHIRNSSFVPANITIKKGTRVTWVNDDTTQHNVVADDSVTGGLPTQNNLLAKGASYSFTFNTAGTFDYHCMPHPFMTGTVTVQ